MRLCGWRTNGKRECPDPGEILFEEGPRWLCMGHAAAVERLREYRRREGERWLGQTETVQERAGRLKRGRS
ncbi:hypothetical protein [Nocardioides sp. GXQ0305]|uniref:hypothetical protein n=1 Tax=Nocardioides sp. GXQ0305 TaxID=3423912 RepID=UPI003D7E08C7